MFTSPQTLTVNTVDTSCHRTQSEKTTSLYVSDDGNTSLRISHQETKNRMRRMSRLDRTKIAADPLTGVNTYQKAGIYIVIDEPNFGFNNDEITQLVDALKGWLTADNVSAMLASRH